MNNKPTTPKLTRAKAQRAISALVALMETQEMLSEQDTLDDACDAIRYACQHAGVQL